jgi:hypothetical protein
MGGMTIWTIVISALAVVAGIAGAILSAQLTAKNQTANLIRSMSEERNRARDADKRQVYANFLAVVNEFSIGTTGAYAMETDPEKQTGVILGALPKRGTIYSRLSELELIAPDEVSSHAQTLVSRVMDLQDELLQGSRPRGSRPRNVSLIDETEKKLLKVMRANLGIESESPANSGAALPAPSS